MIPRGLYSTPFAVVGFGLTSRCPRQAVLMDQVVKKPIRISAVHIRWRDLKVTPMRGKPK
jgi:hypothetical protein